MEQKVRTTALTALLLASTLSWSADLPVPCSSDACAGEVWVASAELAAYSTGGGVGTIDQFADRVVLNWESFDIAEGARVVFNQPRDISVALNRIFDQSPSQLLGAIDANGQIYLINPNGFVFGANSRINTNTLLASALNISDRVFEDTGLAGAVNSDIAALEVFEDRNDGRIVIEAGAEITTSEGGRIMLFAPEIINGGRLETPGGQTLLGASSDKVYLQFSNDPALRGFVLEVTSGGRVSNTPDSEIVAERGNVTVAGLLLEQQGVVRSSTTIDENGSINLFARDGVNIVRTPTGNEIRPGATGTLKIGEGSLIEVLPDKADTQVAVDAKPQGRSTIALMGREIEVGRDVSLLAPGGEIRIQATQTPVRPFSSNVPNDAILTIAEGVRIDASGTTDTVVPVSRNQVELDLRSNELADSPLQRSGVARGETVFVDRRRGTPFANVNDAIENLERSVEERLSVGGSVVIQGEGDVVIGPDVVIDVSGGTVTYTGGVVTSTKLLKGNEVVDISEADPDVVYDGIFSGAVKTHSDWGVTELFSDSTGTAEAEFESGYVEGRDAGSVTLSAGRLDMQGKLFANTVSSRYQRAPSEQLAGGTSALARPFDQLARGGALALATLEGDLVIGSEPEDSIPNQSLIAPELLTDSGLTQVGITLRDDLVVQRNTDLQMPGGTSLEVLAEDIRFNGSFRAPAGRIELTASPVDEADLGSISFGDAASINVAGAWVNDFAFGSMPGADPLWYEGGAVSMRADRDLIMSPLSGIVVDGGAWLRSNETLVTGTGGSIRLESGLGGRPSRFAPTSNLNGYGIERGGSLTLAGDALAVYQLDFPPVSFPELEPAITGELADNPWDETSFIEGFNVFIPSFLLRNSGFEDIALRSTRSGIVVDGVVRPRLANRFLRDGFERIESGDSLAIVSRLSSVTFLPDYQRRPANLTLEHRPINGISASEASGVILRPGAAIQLDPEGTVSLISESNLWINGARLAAPSGRIDLRLNAPDNPDFFDPVQSIRIASGSELNVHGTFIEIPNNLDLRRGRLLDGGTINIVAEQGSIVVEGASSPDEGGRSAAAPIFDIGGTAADIDVPAGDPLRFERTRLASDGGLLNIVSAEGGIFRGTIEARNDQSASRGDAFAGRLAVTVDASSRNVDADVNAGAPAALRFTNDPRTLLVTEAPRAIDFAYAETVTGQRGRLDLAVESFARAGLDGVTLRAVDIIPVAGVFGAETARIEFAQDTSIQTLGSVELFAPNIDVAGAHSVDVRAPYVALGFDQVLEFPESSLLGDLAGSFTAEAAFVDLRGIFQLGGAGRVVLTSDSDVRLRGELDQQQGRALVGGLTTSGSLEIAAAQLYTASASNFAIDVRGERFSLSNDGKASGPVHSFLGSLELSAPEILIDAGLMAPGGRLRVESPGLVELGDSGRLTTALATDDVLFGRLQAGLDWIYPLPNSNLQLYDSLPDSGIEIVAGTLSSAPASSIDASGGGNVLAYEFIAGPGGSSDFLAPQNTPATYAILPANEASAAPFDFFESSGFDRLPLDSVVLDAAGGFEGGEFALLPARYALLPGALLVTQLEGVQYLADGEVRFTSDGAAVIGGRFGRLGSELANSRVQGFRIDPGSFAFENSEYQITSATDFFSTSQGRTPADGGDIALDAQSLELLGPIGARAVGEGRDGILAVLASQIELVADDGQATMGFASLSSAEIESLDVGSVILGARIDSVEMASGESLDFLDVRADTVVVRDNVVLEQRDILLTANDSVSIGADVGVRSVAVGSEAVDRRLLISDSDALVWVSRDRLLLERVDDDAPGGQLAIADTASLEGLGSLVLQSPGGDALAGRLRVEGGRADLRLQRLSLGTESGDQGQEAVDADLPREPGLDASGETGDETVAFEEMLSGLAASELVLGGAEEISVGGAVDLTDLELTRLEVDTPLLRAQSGSAARLALGATDIVLTGTQGSDEGPAAGTGILTVSAEGSLTLAGGAMRIDGFRESTFTAGNFIAVEGADAALSVSGELELQSPVLIADRLSSLAVDVVGDLSLRGSQGGTRDGLPSGLSGSLQLMAQNVRVASDIVALSGVVDVRADGTITIEETASIDVSGVAINGAVSRIETPSGRIGLFAGDAIVVSEGSDFDLSSPRGGGSVDIIAAGLVTMSGTLNGSGESDFTLSAGALAEDDAISSNLSGFAGDRSIRLGSGDLVVNADQRIAARNLTLAADDGRVVVEGTLAIADSGRVRLAGLAGVRLEGEVLGERLRIEAETLGDGSNELTLSANVAESSRVSARIDFSQDLADRVDVTGARYANLQVEAVHKLDVEGGTLDGSTFGIGGSIDSLLEAGAPVVQGLRDAGVVDAGTALAQGVWLHSDRDLRVTGGIDLSGLRYNDRPGRLMVTAGGNLHVEAPISDGFRQGALFPSDVLQGDDSWSIGLVAGRDPTAADALATSATTSRIEFASNSWLRSGTGDIDVRAGGDLVFGDSISMIYTSGRRVPIPGIDEVFRLFALHDIEVPVDAGDVDVRVGGDIVSSETAQFVTDYIVRLGGNFLSTSIPTIAGVANNRFSLQGEALPAFQQGIGAFGGGNVRVAAGGDIRNLSVVAPELYRFDGELTLLSGGSQILFDDSLGSTREGGELVSVVAGADLAGGVVYVGAGQGQIQVGGNVVAGDNGLGLIVAQGSADVTLTGGGDVLLETVVDPTIQAQSTGPIPALQSDGELSFYFSYLADTGFALDAIGDVVVSVDTDRMVERLPRPGTGTRQAEALNVFPGDVRFTSATGDVTILGEIVQIPTNDGGVRIAAQRDVRGGPDESFILLSDVDPAVLPSPEAPQPNLNEVVLRFDPSTDPSLLHARTPLHADDPVPSTIEAIEGEINGPVLSLLSAEAVQLVGATGLTLSQVRAQNNRPDDVSLIQSDGSIRIRALRDPDTGRVLANNSVISIAGPGKLEVIAGLGVDLGTSVGIESIGDLENPALADSGADVLVLSGNLGRPDYDGFFSDFIASDPERLQTFAEQNGLTGLEPDEARELFAGLSDSVRREATIEVLFEEIRDSSAQASGLIAQSATTEDIAAAYAIGESAVNALFPEERSYEGDVALFFSRIFTLDGGDIDILVPGGELNVGLTVEFGTLKEASELGIVAQSAGDVSIYTADNVEVNRSRVFTLSGGDIVIWSADGDIDAGRGAKTALATPPLTAELGENDSIRKVTPLAVSGSGIAADDGDSGRLPDILLGTPNGVVDAGDAGIRTPGRLFTAAIDVVGRDNIDVGSFVGSPADTVVLSADLANVGDAASSATEAIAEASVQRSTDDTAAEASDSESALGWLEVFLEGFGPEFCDPSVDTDCLNDTGSE